MNRGEVWRVDTAIGRSFPAILIGNNVLTEVYQRTQIIPIRPAEESLATLVTVRLRSPVEGVAVVADTSPLKTERLTELLGTLSLEQLGEIEVALRAVFDLPPT